MKVTIAASGWRWCEVHSVDCATSGLWGVQANVPFEIPLGPSRRANRGDANALFNSTRKMPTRSKNS